MFGEHNHRLMAVAAARLAGLRKMRSPAIANFLTHRLEHICTCLGIDFINDSKATTTMPPLSSVNSPVILLAVKQSWG